MVPAMQQAMLLMTRLMGFLSFYLKAFVQILAFPVFILGAGDSGLNSNLEFELRLVNKLARYSNMFHWNEEMFLAKHTIYESVTWRASEDWGEMEAEDAG